MNSVPFILEDELLEQVHSIQVDLLKSFKDICDSHGLSYWIDFGTLLGAVRHDGHFIPWDDDLDVSMPREDFQKFIKIAGSELSDSVFLQTAESDPFYDIYMVEAKLRNTNSLFIEFEDAHFHQGVYIDIFPYDKTFSNSMKRHKHQRMYKSWIVGFRQNIISSKPFWKDMRPLRKAILSFYYRFVNCEKVENKILGKWKNDESWVWRPTLASKGDDTPVTDSQLFPLKEINFEGIMVTVPNKTAEHLKSLYGDWETFPPKDQQRPAHCSFVDLNSPCTWEFETGYHFTRPDKSNEKRMK